VHPCNGFAQVSIERCIHRIQFCVITQKLKELSDLKPAFPVEEMPLTDALRLSLKKAI